MVLETNSAIIGLLNCRTPLHSFPQGPLRGQDPVGPRARRKARSSWPEQSNFSANAATCAGPEGMGSQEDSSVPVVDPGSHTPHQDLELPGVGGSPPDQGQLGVGRGTDLKVKPISWAGKSKLALPTSPASSPGGPSGALGACLSIRQHMTLQSSSWLMSQPSSSAATLALMGYDFYVPRVGA